MTIFFLFPGAPPRFKLKPSIKDPVKMSVASPAPSKKST